MNDLTEQWKKGELQDGFYYVKSKWCDRTDIKYIHPVKVDWEEALAPVPSYDAWIFQKNELAAANGLLKYVREQNAQLKELLKEWIQFEIEENPNDFTVMSERMSGLANKTKEVLK